MSHIDNNKQHFTMSLMQCRLLFIILSLLLLVGLALSMDIGGGETAASQFGKLYYYFFIGILAATVANATGAGGGIVFLPVFMSLGMQAHESLATSLAIQCFGMTSGAFAWLAQREKERIHFALQWHDFLRITSIGAISSVIGLFCVQLWMPKPLIDIKVLFSVFSLCVGLIILWRTLRIDLEKSGRHEALNRIELIGLTVVCSVGGAITAWLSVGVGEVLAIYLIFLGFRVNVAIAAAVCVTVATVIPAMPHHLLLDTSPLRYEVLVYAAPGALIGGAIAKRLAVLLGAHRTKLMMSLWIIISACVYLALILF